MEHLVLLPLEETAVLSVTIDTLNGLSKRQNPIEIRSLQEREVKNST